MSTIQLTGVKARKKIMSGVTKVHDIIKTTLGPAGQSVLVPRSFSRGQRVIDDGYVTAEIIDLKDPHEKLAADFYKEAIAKTNMLEGDGTTGTGVFSYAVFNNASKLLPDSDITIVLPPGEKVKKWKSSRELREEMIAAKDLVLAEVMKQAKQVKTLADLERIATISIGKEDEETAKVIAKIVWEVARDKDGNYIDNHIEVTDGYKGEIETEVIRGMRFPAKVSAPAFANRPERHEMVCEEIPVLITNQKMDNGMVVQKILETAKVSKIAIFAPDFSVGVLQYMAKVTQGGLHVFPIKTPALRTAQMEDLALYCGATVIDKDTGMKLENFVPTQLGFAEKIVVKDTENREDAVLLGGRGEKTKRGQGNLIDERIAILRGQQKEARNDVEKLSLEKRIANLGSAVGIIRVGSTTNADAAFLKMKIEDGMYACKGALRKGYVKGGGLCLKEIAEKLPASILTEALKAPYEQIQRNAGGNLEIGKDVIDPASVVCAIVEHGTSVASTLIMAESVIADEPERSPADGYKDIADSIKLYATYWARQQGIIKLNEDEAEDDRNREFERVMAGDHG